MARQRFQPTRARVERITLAAPIGVHPRREGRRGMCTPLSYGLAEITAARVREGREGPAPRPPPVGIGGNIVRQIRAFYRAFSPIVIPDRPQPTLQLTP